MSNSFSIEVTEAELDVVRLALGRMLDPKPVRAKASAKVTALPTFDTGNDALDAFMRRSWKPAHRAAALKRAAAGLVNPAPLKPRAWTKADHEGLARFNEAAVIAWKLYGYTVEVEGGSIEPNGSNVRVTR